MAEHRKSLLECDREYRLKEELDKQYCRENGMVYQKSLLSVDQARESWYSEIIEHLGCQSDNLSVDVFNTRKANKETLCEWLSDADDLVEKYDTVVKHLLSIVDKSKSELIVVQQKVVNLQEELLEKKE
jgi:hypothetical protein